MSTVCTGIIGDAPSHAVKVFFGAHPERTVEKRLNRQLHNVFPWFMSRKRVKEQANEFFEVDMASCDTDIMQRYCHIFYVRRQIHEAILDKQNSMLEGGKPPKLADQSVLRCLTEMNGMMGVRFQEEIKQLAAIKRGCNVPYRRELEPSAELHAHDLACMMRCAEEDACSEQDIEARSKQHLDVTQVADVLNVTKTAFGYDAAKGLENKEAKLLNKHVAADYKRVGYEPKYRPVDVTTHFKFVGDRLPSASEHNPEFASFLVGHMFRRYATHPSILQRCGKSKENPGNKGDMSKALAGDACTQQLLFPAIKFRSQFMYTSAETARQFWNKEEMFVPCFRMFPLLGHAAAEDLLAGSLVDGFFGTNVPADVNPLEDAVLRKCKDFISEVLHKRDSNVDLLLDKALEFTKASVPASTATAEDGEAEQGQEGGQGEEETIKAE